MKRNVPAFGLFIGLVLPILGILLVAFLFASTQHASLGSFLSGMKSNHDAAAKVCTLGLLINIAPFIYFTNKRLDQTAKGIFIATVLYAVIIVLLKYVW